MEAIEVERRKSNRFKIKKGVIFLRKLGLPSLVGDLTDLGIGGCRCLVLLDRLNESTSTRWRSTLLSGNRLFADLSAQPHLSPIHLNIEVKYTLPKDDGQLELGIAFLDMESDERQLLDIAHAVIAPEKPAASTSSTRLSAFAPTDGVKKETTAIIRKSGGYPPLETADTSKEAPAQTPATKKLKDWFAVPEVPISGDPYRGKRLGQILVSLGKISENDVEDAQKKAREMGDKLGRYLLRGGWITPIELCSALSMQTGMPIVDLSEQKEVPPNLAKIFSYLMMLQFECVPYEETPEVMRLASTHPLSPRQTKDLQDRCGKKVEVSLGEDDQVVRLLYSLQPKKNRKLRKQARYKLNVPVSFSFFNRQLALLNDEVLTGETIDVSESGLMIGTSADLKNRGSCIKISFVFAPQEIECLCSIRYIHKNKAQGDGEFPWIVGLQIADITPENRGKLKEMCIRLAVWLLRKGFQGGVSDG